MLIYLVSHDLYRFLSDRTLLKMVLLIFSSLGLFLSGTRAHMLIAVFFPLFILLAFYLRRSWFILFISICSIIAGVIVFSSGVFSAFFSPAEASNSIKIGMLENYILLFSDIRLFLFGQGFNAHDFSPLVRNMIVAGGSKTELTYFELLRVFGFFVSGLFFISIAFLLFKTLRLPSNYRWVFPGLIVYLINSSLNPYLFSSNGIYPLALFLAAVSFSDFSYQFEKRFVRPDFSKPILSSRTVCG